jgi:RNA polymerase sigma-70 factor (ECF subfamily)
MKERAGDITELLNRASSQERGASEGGGADRLWELVYPELRRRAGAIFHGERDGHTLSATAVVNETFVRLSSRKPHEWEDRSHFYAVAAGIMRHVLIDHARARAADKRGGGARKEPLDEAVFPAMQADEEGLAAAGEALELLAEEHERAALVVALHVFGGLTFREISDELAVSERTVKNDWALAKDELQRLLG